MSTWFSQGYKEAEKMASQAGPRRKQRNFWTKPGESATIRFLRPAKESFNYKRAFIPWAQGQKLYTSPGIQPDPLVEAGLALQAAFAWPVLDRRKFDFEVEEDGKQVTKSVGPRVLYFADGQRTRKALIAFENEIRNQINEERVEEGKEPLSESDYNLTSFDIKVVKDKGAPWQFFALRGGQPKELAKEDKDIVEKSSFDLREELKPLPNEVLRDLATQQHSKESDGNEESTYSYGEEQEEETTFFE